MSDLRMLETKKKCVLARRRLENRGYCKFSGEKAMGVTQRDIEETSQSTNDRISAETEMID